MYINVGYFGGSVFAYDMATGAFLWNAPGGSYGMNTPAVDDDHVYAYDGTSLNVLNPDGSLFKSIGPSSGGSGIDYYGAPILGDADHVLAFNGSGQYGQDARRQLLDYSVARGALRWMSTSLYASYPAVAKGVVYAASSETWTLDALDEATGRILWSWKPP